MRNLLLFFLLLLVVHFVRRWWQRSDAPQERGGEQAAPAEPERMVECAHCGLLVPESEAVSDGGRDFCSPEHAHLGVGGGR